MDKLHYEFFNTIELLIFFRHRDKLFDSIIRLMTQHREHDFMLFDFVIEAYHRYQKYGQDVKYLLAYRQNEIITISRLFYKNENGFINAVHTNKKYRGKGYCRKNLKKLTDLANKKLKINKFTLEVEIDNIPAIKCYEKVGFKIKKKIKNEYQMILIK